MNKIHCLKRLPFPTLVFAVFLLFSIVLPYSAAAQEEEGRVQRARGRIEVGEVMHYVLPDLQEGDTLYAYMRHESGNLDPALLLVDPDVLTPDIGEILQAEREALIAEGTDPIAALAQVLNEYSLAADDNGGQDSDAAIEYFIPEDGEYRLLALGTPVNDTFGEYELLIGINEPAVLGGSDQPSGDVIATLDREASGIATAVQEAGGELSPERAQQVFTLKDVQEGDTIYAYVEATEGNLIPLLSLQDFSGRTLRLANTTERARSASFEFPANETIDNYRILITPCCEGAELTEGSFRLLVGINEAAVLNGDAQPAGREVLRGAQTVDISVSLEQITGVDQKAENYGGVYRVEMRWHDPARAFSPDDCRCLFKTFTGSGFNSLVSDENFRWPEFNIYNQQNNRWIQNQGIINYTNGDMTYFERFTTTLQAPDFNFRAFPFDLQRFFLRIDQLYPENFFVYNGPAELSQVGPQLGEEEWRIVDWGTSVESIPGLGINPSSSFVFEFEANRHLIFYIMRIFLPTILIIVVSYFTFFLKDYSKRIDVNSANLLVFVAFNFTISAELPRLGYLTFMDAVLAGVFVITALVVAFNVYLRRLELNGQGERARKIDSYTLWLYPVAYLVGAAVLVIVFLAPEYWQRILALVGLG